MKNQTPNRIALSTSAILGLLVLFALLIISNFSVKPLAWHVIVLPPVIATVTGYLVYRYFLERFIYRKIKNIYKTIHRLKAPSGAISEKIKLNEDLLSNVDSEVDDWTQGQSLEIQQLKQRATYRREFLGNLSHELKTPMFNIQGFLETLLDGGMQDKEISAKYLRKASENVDRLNTIINDLETIAHKEDGKFELDITKFDIHKLFASVFEELDTKAANKDIQLGFKPDCDMSFHILADKEKIRRVIINLVDNSIKYGKRGGRTLVGFYDMGDNVLSEVSDDGIGIEESLIPRLHERFYRVDKSRSRDQGGTGLGLSIVKHIIEAHDQTINVRSTIGVGSTFGFTLQKA